jgi:hypothetical protein
MIYAERDRIYTAPHNLNLIQGGAKIMKNTTRAWHHRAMLIPTNNEY